MKKKNYGIDILRILSMLGVIILHFFVRGQMLEFAGNNVKFYIVNFFEIMAFCAVNTFAMITGYLYINKTKEEMKTANIFKLIFTIMFYSIIITIICNIFFKNLIPYDSNIFFSLFPSIIGSYWYITCYIPLFFLIPYINKMLNNLTKKEFKTLIILIFILFSIIPTLGLYDFFRTYEGYSTIWLIICYIIGAYIKIYDPLKNIKTIKLFLLFIFNVILVLLSRNIINLSNEKFFEITKITFSEWQLRTYISPFIIINAILLISIFKKIKIENNIMQKITIFLSSTAFGVYIIHTHIVIYYNLLPYLNYFYNLRIRYFIISIFIVPALIYIICSLIEKVRLLIFKYTKIDFIINKLGRKVDNLIYK